MRRRVFLPLRYIYYMLQHALRPWFWFAQNRSLGSIKLGPHFFANTLYIAFLQMTPRNQPVSKVLDRVFGSCCEFDLFFLTVGLNIGATRMSVQQTQA